jgi:membrane protease YdiL (CAAX protease family)
LQTLLGDYVAMPLAIGISSALFALSHAAKPIIMALVFVVGIMFGVVFWQTGSLLGVIVGHFLYDVFALWYVLRRMGRLDVEDAAPG